MAAISPSRDLRQLEDSNTILLPFLSPTVTPSHEDSDPYHEIIFIPFQPPTKIDFGTARLRESKSCKLNIFNPKDELLTVLLVAPSEGTPVQVETLRIPIADAETTLPFSEDSRLFHLPPSSSALLRITWSPVTTDDLYASLVFKWSSRFTSKVSLYGKIEVVTKKSHRILFGDSQTSFVKQQIPSAFRAPLSTLTLNSPLVDKCMNPPKHHTFITTVPSNTLLDVNDSTLSQPSRSFVASTPIEHNATRALISLPGPGEHSFLKPSVIKNCPPNKQDSTGDAAKRSLTFSLPGPGAGSFDSQWADKQIRAFTNWLNFILTPQDSSNFTSLQSDCSPTSRKDAINLTASLRSFSSPSDMEEPSYSITQRKYLYRLRSNMQALYTSPDITATLYQLHAEVEKSRLKMRPEKPVWKDVGLKEDLLRTLLSYHPLWLRLGLEAIFSCTVPVSHEMDSKMIRKFLDHHLFNSAAISSRFSHRKVPGLFVKGHDKVVSKHILFKYFSLILLLDIAKDHKIIDHDPRLFNKNSRIKSSREMLLYFSSNFLQGEGDITKHLGNIGYRVSHKQSFLDEFDYQVKNLALDLRDGIRLSRLLELLTQDWGLSKKLRLPATSLNPRLGNTKLFLDKLEELTHFNFNISSRDIAIGHKEKTLSLIWALIFHFRIAIKLDDALLRTEIAFIRAKHSIQESCIPVKLGSINGCNQFGSVTLQLLLEWSSVICRVFGLRVTDFTSSFKDGRALCYILHYYHPALLSKHFISADPKSNLEEFSDKLSSLGGIPTLPPSSDFFQTGPNEKVVIMYLAYLCGQQLELREEIRAAVVIQRAYKRHTYRKHQEQLEQSSYESQLSEFHIQFRSCRTVKNRGYKARRELAVKSCEDNKLSIQFVSNFTVSTVLNRASTSLLQERLHCIVTIQRCYRKWCSYKLALSVRGNFIALKSIVISLQRAIRRHIARKIHYSSLIESTAGQLVYTTLMRSYTLINQEIEKSTITIQSIYRGYKARRELAFKSCEDNKLSIQFVSNFTVSTVLNTASTSLLQERLHCIVTIQRCYRRWCSYKLALSLRGNFIALKSIVISLQRAIRRHIARKIHYSSLIESTAGQLVYTTLMRSCTLINQEIEKSTITIQSIYRGYKARRELAVKSCEDNKLSIQFISNFTVSTVLNKASTSLLQERMHCIVTIQRCYRKWCSYKLALSLRGNFISLKSIVITLQRAIRRHIARKIHYSSLIESTAGQLVYTTLMQSCTLINQEIEKSTITIQSIYRGYKARRELKLLILQVNERCIQTYSCFLVQNIIISSSAELHHQMLSSALTIQKSYYKWSASKLALSERRHFLYLRRSVISLQRALRHYLAVRKLNYSLMESGINGFIHSILLKSCHSINSDYIRAAITMQSFYRGARTRRELEIEARAATTIQSSYRGYFVRRNMQSSLHIIKHRLSDATKSAETCNQLMNKVPKYMDILLNSRSLAQKYDILDNLKTAVYVSEVCAIRVRREGLEILYKMVDNHVRSPSTMQRVEKAAEVLLQLTKWPSISNDIFIYGQSIPIIADLLQKIYLSQPSTLRVLCQLLIAFCKHSDQVDLIHKYHHVSIEKLHRVLGILKRKYSIGAKRMLGKAKKDLAQSIHTLERVFIHFRYIV